MKKEKLTIRNKIPESNQITPEFQELKKQQAAIKDQQNFLIKISNDLKINR
jgi:hypothetical protein